MATIYGQFLAMAQGLSKPFAMIEVTFPSGTAVVLTGNGKTWQPVSSTSTENVYLVTDIDYTYTLTGTKSGTTKTITILVDKAYNSYQYSISFNPSWHDSLKTLLVGNYISIDGYEWTIVHKTDTAATLGLRYWYTDAVFGNSGIYNGSTLAGSCATFENGLSTETKQYLNNVTVNGVTAKVFIPSLEQVGTSSSGSGIFSYYTDNTKRMFTTSSISGKPWWTSSPGGSSYVWYVQPDGSLLNRVVGTATSYGFRPHMEVNLTL